MTVAVTSRTRPTRRCSTSITSEPRSSLRNATLPSPARLASAQRGLEFLDSAVPDLALTRRGLSYPSASLDISGRRPLSTLEPGLTRKPDFSVSVYHRGLGGKLNWRGIGVEFSERGVYNRPDPEEATQLLARVF